MHHSKIKKMSIALGMALLPISVFAAGLGQLNINSGIGEPLKADIELLSVTSAELATLKARIAPESAYAAQGIERTFLHGDINVQITRNSAGKRVLKLTSNKPVTEPFLDMLVEVEWETGSVLREYTVLLDPPGYKSEPAPAPIETPTISATDSAPVKKATAPVKKAPSKASSTTKPTVSAPADQSLTDDYLTKKGDTLSKIARDMKPEGVSLDQMLVGLFEANPDAFVGENMNRLKVGKILQPPSEEALNAITRKQAAKEIKLHTANWNEYRNKLAGIVAESAPEESEVDTQTTSGKIKPATQDDSVPESTGPKDVVKLSSATPSEAEADMQARITALEEEVSAREKGLKEAQERTAALEKQIEDMQKLLALKSDEMAQVQEQAAQAVADASKQAEAVTGEVKSADEAGTEESATQPEVADVPAPTPPEPVVESKPEVKPKPVPTPQPAPVEEAPSFISGIIDNVTGVFKGLNTAILGAAGGLIALLLAGWLYLRNKRKKNLADFEQGIMTSGGLKANTVFGNTSGASVDTGDTSFLTDFSQSTSGGMIDTNDVDPIAEAEVYMAYGRDAQAEEILKDAIAKEPKRYELHLKLLEMYAASKNMSAFETVSGELYTSLGADDPTWAKVAEIGIKLEPNNPLYQAKAGMGGEAADSDAPVAPADDTASDEKLDASAFSDSPLAEEADLDFSLNDIGIDAKTEPMADAPTEPETVAEEADSAVLEQAVAEPASEADEALEFDLGATPEPVAESETVAPVEGDANFAHTMPNLEFPKTEDDIQAEADEMQDAAETLQADGLTLDMPETAEETVEEATPIQVEESKPADEGFDFNIDTIAEDTITLDGGEDSQATSPQVDETSNVLDMSDISLDVNEDVNQAIDEATAAAEIIEAEVEPVASTAEPDEIEAPSIEINEEPVVEAVSEATEAPQISTEPESEEVETKLELVAAYIDMEDKEGAKELLEEVLKEGGPNQRKRAEEIMANIG